MDGKSESRVPQPRIDASAKARFLAALRRGETREQAAAGAGFSLTGFYGARRRDPDFGAAWQEALAAPPAAERRVRAYAGRGARAEQGRGEVRIAPANRRLFQRRRRWVRFDARRRELFLTHFATSCDKRAAAAAAGVSISTVTYHCRIYPDFAEACAEALAQGYVFLEAEAVRQRVAAQAKLRAAIAAAGPTKALLADEAEEFDRVMKLLARRDRKPRRAERGFKEGGRRQKWTFEDAIILLARKLRGLGIPVLPLQGEAGEAGE